MMKVFMILLTTFVSQAISKGGNPTSKRLLDLPHADDSVVLPVTNFFLISNASVFLEQTQSLPYHVRLLNPGDAFPCL